MVLVGIAALVGIVGLCCWLVTDALQSGVVRARGGSYSRSEDPAWFWAMLALYVGMAAMVIYTVAYMVLPWEWVN
jgi:hypothetical protein